MPIQCTRREALKLAAFCAVGHSLSSVWAQPVPAAKDLLVYIGTYTSGASQGIYVFRLNAVTGELSPAAKSLKVDNPSYLTFHPSRQFLYAANETSKWNGQSGGSVSALAIDPQSGELTLINQQSSRGSSPCYVSADPTGKWVMAANYSSGNAALLPVQEGGGLEPASDVVQHKGSSVNKQRQEGPHAHSIVLDPAGRFVFVSDLGIDKIMIYRLDTENGKLVPNDPPFFAADPGSGPRHFTFHPNGKLAFLIQELKSTITSFTYDAEKGVLEKVQTVSALPESFSGSNSCADIHVHPNGKFVYGSNRGHNSIVAFAIDEATGQLSYVAHEPTQGKTPRNFAIDPSGTYLMAANQDSGTIVSFRIDGDSGKLTPTGHVTKVPMPVCVLFKPEEAAGVNDEPAASR